MVLATFIQKEHGARRGLRFARQGRPRRAPRQTGVRRSTKGRIEHEDRAMPKAQNASAKVFPHDIVHPPVPPPRVTYFYMDGRGQETGL